MKRAQMKVTKQAHHRNGISNAPFVVTLFEEAPDGPFVAISFVGATKAQFEVNTAVLSIPKTAAGNIEFSGGNSWRGDHFAGEIADAWEKRCAEQGYKAWEEE